MKKFIISAVIIILFSLTVPSVTYKNISSAKEEKKDNRDYSATVQAVQPRNDETVQVFSHTDNKKETIPMSEYLIGVVAAEMPAEYEPEALKAQAVASKAYAKYTLSAKDSISTDSNTNQGYITENDMRKLWGDKFDENYKKIKSAVESTDNMYLEYNGEPILAAYFAISSGRTENAADVWGKDYPYLTSVTSDGDILAPDYEAEVSFTREELFSKLQQNAKLGKKTDEVIGKTERTESGNIKTIEMFGTEFTGTQLREALGLRSCCIEITEDGDNILFSVKGYGHGVGMSQYGADYMARQGADFAEILLHYYPGAQIVQRD